MGEVPEPTGDQLLRVLSALGNPHRMRIVAALAERRNYVSALAREIGMGRPLLHMHLQRLEAAGLITGSLEVGEDGRTVKYFEVADFHYALTPEVITRSVASLSADDSRSREGAETARPAKGEAK